MTTLKDETIKGIQAEGQYNQADFGYYADHQTGQCNTPTCIAGHIVAAAARLGRKLPDGEFLDSNDANAVFKAKGLTDDGDDTPRAARLLWARAYGKNSANELDFYAHSDDMYKAYKDAGWDMRSIPPSVAINHLERVAKVK